MFNVTLLKHLLKLLVTMSCFLVIGWKINFDEIIILAKLISIKTIIISIFIFIAHYFAVSLRWQFYVNSMNFYISFRNTIKLVSIGLLANQLFFGSIAMDGIRVMYLNKKTSFTIALGSVFLDRYVAFHTMWVLLVLVFMFDNSFSNKYFINNTIILICWGGLTSLILLFIKNINFYKSSKLMKFLYSVSEGFICTFKNFKNFTLVYMSSFFILLSSGIVTWLITIDLGIQISFLPVLIVTLLGILISAIPISINGWGIREISFISLLGSMNISNEKSVLISVIFGLILLTSSVLGIFFYLLIPEDNKEKFVI